MDYPLTGLHFKVEFSGIDDLTENDVRFQEVSGLSTEISTEDLKEGGENRFTHKLPLPAAYPNLVLKRGMMKNTGLVTWFRNAIENFSFKPVMLTVSLLDEEHKPVMSWNFVNAYPVKWSVSDLDATKNEVAIDTVEITYQYYTQIF
jgi:phage tail-like protein